jgi:hypothetical protein
MSKLAIISFNSMIILILLSTAQAEQITKPYTFEAGQPAKANEVNQNFDVLYNKLNEMDQYVNKPIIWSGGCGHDGSGYPVVYCTDSIDFNTLQDYLQTTNQGTFTILVPGFYRINAFAHYTDVWGYGKGIALVVNGTSVEGHNYKGDISHGELKLDIVWPFNTGETFYISCYSEVGANAFTRWTPTNSSSRLQVSYLGPK